MFKEHIVEHNIMFSVHKFKLGSVFIDVKMAGHKLKHAVTSVSVTSVSATQMT